MTATVEQRGAPRGPDGRFHNPWPHSVPHGWRALLAWSRDRRRMPPPPSPPRGSFPVATPEISRPRAGTDELTATWIGHSTVLIQLAGLNLITDPVFSERAFPVQWMGPRRLMAPALALEELPPLDLILISHSHYDHLDRPAVRRLAKAHPAASWVVPLGLGRYIRGWVGSAGAITELDWWQEAEVRGVRVTGTPSRHFSARRLGDRNRTLWCGFAMEAAGRRVWFAGDTAYHPEFGAVGARLGPFDLVMIPIGAYDPRWFMERVHVDPDEAVRVYRDVIGPHPEAARPLMLGLHWGTFRLTDEPMDEPPRRTAASWQEAKLPADRLWIARFGETRRP